MDIESYQAAKISEGIFTLDVILLPDDPQWVEKATAMARINGTELGKTMEAGSRLGTQTVQIPGMYDSISIFLPLLMYVLSYKTWFADGHWYRGIPDCLTRPGNCALR